MPSPATTTRWMICRTISLRSAIVVVGACHRAGMLCASCTIASRSAAESDVGLRLHKALILLLQVPVGHELVFPLLGELAGDQAMFGLDQAVVAGSPFRLIGRPLQALVPQPVEVLPFLLETRGRLQRQRERGGFKRGEDPLTDEGIDRLAREILAIVPAIVGGQPITRVAMHGGGAPIAHLHATAAPSTDQQARQQRWAMPYGAQRLGTGAVGF